MKKIPFVKYTSCGNNFVIVDQTDDQSFSEAEMSHFAFQATNANFGVGCDNLLIIQSCTDDNLQAINAERGYWEVTPCACEADYLFRMFEPSGEEALCCGNGLMCVANYLYDAYGIGDAQVMTEIPFQQPRVRQIGTSNRLGAINDKGLEHHVWRWVNMGSPRRTPAVLATPRYFTSISDVIDGLSELRINIQLDKLIPNMGSKNLALSAKLVFTGEPHLVIFPEQDFNLPELSDYIFGLQGNEGCFNLDESVGSCLVNQIGLYINNTYQEIFPKGINVNFARIIDGGLVENRCFERGVNRETLACGTGAMAVAYAAQDQSNTQSFFDILPHRCRWHDEQARILVEYRENGWYLKTQPSMLFEGRYRYVPQRPQVPQLSRFVVNGKINSADHGLATEQDAIPLAVAGIPLPLPGF